MERNKEGELQKKQRVSQKIVISKYGRKMGCGIGESGEEQ